MKLALLFATLACACGGSAKQWEPPANGTLPEGSFFHSKADAVHDKRFREGPGGFPLPADAQDCRDMPNRDLVCKVPRPRDPVHGQLIAYLAERGYTIGYIGQDGTTASPEKRTIAGGYRMYIDNATAHYMVSVTENDNASTLLTVTVK